jgi:hypothetical protein
MSSNFFSLINSEKAKRIMKGAAVGAAFMVPVAGIPLALLVAKRLYGNPTPEQVKEIEEKLGKFKEWLELDENTNQ